MIRILNELVGSVVLRIAKLVLQFDKRMSLQFENVMCTINGNAVQRAARLPSHLVAFVVMIEDRRFYEHRGVDAYANARASVANVTGKGLQGASTITQQLVRNSTGDRRICVERKIREVMLACLVDAACNKADIVAAYYFTYDFEGATGIAALCQYEGISLNTLSVTICAQLVARLKYPVLRRSNYSRYLKRVRALEIRQEKLARSDRMKS